MRRSELKFLIDAFLHPVAQRGISSNVNKKMHGGEPTIHQLPCMLFNMCYFKNFRYGSIPPDFIVCRPMVINMLMNLKDSSQRIENFSRLTLFQDSGVIPCFSFSVLSVSIDRTCFEDLNSLFLDRFDHNWIQRRFLSTDFKSDVIFFYL